MSNDIIWDVFISHASEDKKRVASPLTKALEKLGLDVWLDKNQIELGDNLRQKIEEGLSKSRLGVIIISPSFLKKEWTAKELDALISRDLKSKKVILPIWHECSEDFVTTNFPLMHGKLAISTEAGITEIAKRIYSVVKNSPLEIRDEPDFVEVHIQKHFTSLEVYYEIKAKKSDKIDYDSKQKVVEDIRPHAEKIAATILGKEIKINGKPKLDTYFFANPPDTQGKLTAEIEVRASGFTSELDKALVPVAFGISLEDDWDFSHSIFTQNTFRIYFAHMGTSETESQFAARYSVDMVTDLFKAIRSALRDVIRSIIKDNTIEIEIGRVNFEEDSFPRLGSNAYTAYGIVTPGNKE